MSYCIKCGNELVEGSNFCSRCGNKIINSNEDVKSEVLIDMTADRELELFVGEKKRNYYVPIFQKFADPANKQYTSWNVAAFFLTFFWLSYRKMYVLAIGMSAGFFIITEILPDKLTTPLGIAVGVFLGLYGNKFYYDHSQKEINKIKSKTTDLNIQQKIMADKGRTSILFAIVFAIVYLGTAFTFGFISALK